MWTRGKFVSEYVPGLFALAVDSYQNAKAVSMWADLVGVKTSAKKLTVKQLDNWISKYRKTVKDVQKASENKQAVKLRDAQRNLDKMLGFG
jgi:hypothetical protein